MIEHNKRVQYQNISKQCAYIPTPNHIKHPPSLRKHVDILWRDHYHVVSGQNANYFSDRIELLQYQSSPAFQSVKCFPVWLWLGSIVKVWHWPAFVESLSVPTTWINTNCVQPCSTYISKLHPCALMQPPPLDICSCQIQLLSPQPPSSLRTIRNSEWPGTFFANSSASFRNKYCTCLGSYCSHFTSLA